MSEEEKTKKGEAKGGDDCGDPPAEGTGTKQATEGEKNDTPHSDGDDEASVGTKSANSKAQVEPNGASDGNLDPSPGEAASNSNSNASNRNSNSNTASGETQEQGHGHGQEKASTSPPSSQNEMKSKTADKADGDSTMKKESLTNENDADADPKASDLPTIPETVPSIPPTPVQKMKRANTTGQFISSRSSSTSDNSGAGSGSGSSSGTRTSNNNISSNSQKSAFLSRSQSDRGVYQQFQQGQGIDAHPYARGSVIEVLYGVAPRKMRSRRTSDDEDDDEDEDDEDEDEEEEEEDDMMMDVDVKMEEEGGEKGGNQDGTESGSGQEVRLADIIDRAPSDTPDHELPPYRWKYYIHYREYNRRMDEWITDPARIISPPSIGNAKVRAMKKAQAAKAEEERRMREREKREREALAWAEVHEKRRKMGGGEGGDDAAAGPDEIGSSGSLGNLSPFPRPVSQRASSRRASAAIAASSSNHQSSSSGAIASTDIDGAGSATSATLLDEQERLRLTRSQRRKSTRGTGGGAGGTGGNAGDDADESGNKKNTSGTTVTTLLPPDDEIIQDKVVTVAAQELDEHEGLDEAALREHEEVTKVKNVKEVELGRYRMVRN